MSEKTINLGPMKGCEIMLREEGGMILVLETSMGEKIKFDCPEVELSANHIYILPFIFGEQQGSELKDRECTCHPTRTSQCGIHGYSDLLSKRK